MLAALEHFNITAPASEGAIQKFEQLSGFVLPEDYVTFLKKSNGGEGFVGDNAYLILWPVEQLLELNDAYQVPKYAPGLLLFGSDGGGEGFAFDTRLPELPIVSVPFVGMDCSLARPIATSFNGFLEALMKA